MDNCRPPSSRVGDVVGAHIDGMPGGLTEILHHHPAALPLRTRVHANPRIHRHGSVAIVAVYPLNAHLEPPG